MLLDGLFSGKASFRAYMVAFRTLDDANRSAIACATIAAVFNLEIIVQVYPFPEEPCVLTLCSPLCAWEADRRIAPCFQYGKVRPLPPNILAELQSVYEENSRRGMWISTPLSYTYHIALT
jgi:hypothetical protein